MAHRELNEIVRSRMAIEGGCFCGAVRYSATANPLGSMVCHCRTCRAVAGAPVVPWVTFDKSAFAWTRGQPAILKSSSSVTRTFCSACGTPLGYENAGTPTEIDITTCSLDDPNAFPPTHHSWLSHDLNWIRLGDGLPTYPKSKLDAENG